jgi:hypothetical protein
MLHLLTAGYGTSRTSQDVRLESAKWGKADLDQIAVTNRNFMSTRPYHRTWADYLFRETPLKDDW